MKTVFKLEDKVYHYKYGWGVVTHFSQALIRVNFKDNPKYLAIDNELLSFTEYSLQGFSQERPIKLPEVGELCLVRDDTDEDWSVVEFKEYDPSRPLPFIDKNDEGFKYMKRIKILD